MQVKKMFVAAAVAGGMGAASMGLVGAPAAATRPRRTDRQRSARTHRAGHRCATRPLGQAVEVGPLTAGVARPE